MLVELEFRLEKEWVNKGVYLAHRKMEFNEDALKGEFYEAHYNPNHPFWADKFDHQVERNTRVGSILQTLTPGVLAGYCADMFINNFTNYNVDNECEYGMIDPKTGLIYTRKEFSEYMDNVHELYENPDKLLSTGRVAPRNMGSLCCTYGSADNLQQVFRKFKNVINGTENIVIVYHPVHKKNSGDYRFHKNGEYIGKLRSKHRYEYLRDEPKIESIIQYQIIKVNKKETV